MDAVISPAQPVETRTAWHIPIAALGFRIVSAIVALLVNVAFPLYQREQFTVFSHTNAFWDTFARYDSGWYFRIARDGYRFVKGGPPVGFGKAGKIAFFPLYPLLMRWTGHLFGHDPSSLYLGGILVSWACFVAAAVVLYKLAQLDVPRPQAERAAILMAVFPFSFFFGKVYTESLFLLLTLLSFHAFRSRRWIAGGVCGGLASATRVNGVFMLPALAWIAYRNVGRDRRDRMAAALGLVLVPAGIACYSLYIYQLTGNPFEWAASIERWGYHPGNSVWTAPARLIVELSTHPYTYLTTNKMAPYDTLYGVTAIAFAVMTPFVWRRFGPAYGGYMLLNLWLPLSSGTFEGLGRYCSVLFPAFLWMATIQSPVISTAILIVFAMFYTLGLALFTNIHPLY